MCQEPDCGHTSREVAATLDTTWNLLQDNIWYRYLLTFSSEL